MASKVRSPGTGCSSERVHRFQGTFLTAGLQAVSFKVQTI